MAKPCTPHLIAQRVQLFKRGRREKCKNLFLRFQRPALSKDLRQDRAQRSNQEADDADDHIERNFLLEENKREDRRQDGL